ncbi:hypothetical protein N7535_006477 [Penicillium sp. DV-2018c]|nr:hypothetical protein N7461_007438 [Penicillium sp. DV-2018c]KAJ5567171.1 hypothetical protein N7535_006477 [Penicillium sp. DV-2018c]
MPKHIPLTPPATPIALQPHHLLSPPPDRLTNTPTTITITSTNTNTNTQDKKSPQNTTYTSTCIVNHIHPHEPPDSPNRQTHLFTVTSKQWPSTTRIICATDGITPLLILKRIWISAVKKWVLRLPESTETGIALNTKKNESPKRVDLLSASIPWSSEVPGPGKIGLGLGVGYGHGRKLDVRFVNAIRIRPGWRSSSSQSVSASMSRSRSRRRSSQDPHSPDEPEPPPYTASIGAAATATATATTAVGHTDTDSISRSPVQLRPIHTSPTPFIYTSPSADSDILPTYDSVRRTSDPLNAFRDLLDAIEPPQEPAALFQLPTTESRSTARSSGSADGDGDGDGDDNTSSGLKVELRVVQLGAAGMGVMMGNDMIVRVTRCTSVDYSRSKPKARVRWEAEVAEGVDLLLVSLVLDPGYSWIGTRM